MDSIRIAYIRQNDHHGRPASLGGATVAYKVSKEGIMTVTGAICREDEAFVKSKGTQFAKERINSETIDWCVRVDIKEMITGAFLDGAKDVLTKVLKKEDEVLPALSVVDQALKSIIPIESIKASVIHNIATHVFMKHAYRHILDTLAAATKISINPESPVEGEQQ